MEPRTKIRKQSLFTICCPDFTSKALICGGIEKSVRNHRDAWIYDCFENSLTPTGSSQLHKAGSACAKLFLAHKGKEAVLCIGFQNDPRAEIYDIESGTWEVNSDFDFPAVRSSALHFTRGNR